MNQGWVLVWGLVKCISQLLLCDKLSQGLVHANNTRLFLAVVRVAWTKLLLGSPKLTPVGCIPLMGQLGAEVI